jgi:hypothetical protein
MMRDFENIPIKCSDIEATMTDLTEGLIVTSTNQVMQRIPCESISSITDDEEKGC